MPALMIPLLGALPAFGQREEPRPMLTIEWREGPEYPLGIQECAGGVVGGMFVSAGGFSRHPKDVLERYPDTFGGAPSGFTNIAFALDPQNEAAGWARIPDFPGIARQGAAMVVIDDALYAIGGFSYAEPLSYRDVHRLRLEDGEWIWEELPCELPWPACEGCAMAIGTRIYLFGAADYFKAPGAEHADFHSEAGREGDPVGSALLALDTADIAAGWKRLADCPGVPRLDCGATAVNGKIYVLGGIYAPLEKRGAHSYYNAIDSWVYAPATDEWSRLPDMPHGSNRRAVAYADRYVILVGGYKYPQTRLPDGTFVDAYSDEEKSVDWKAFFETTVLVYDAQTETLGTADPLLERTSWPTAAVDGDTILCLGGEGGRLWHPATFQIGTVSEVNR